MVFVAGCAGIAAAEALTADEISKARDWHELKCAKCHKLYDPLEYDSEAWSEWMRKMKKKAHLSDEQYRLISGYLDEVRKDGTKGG